MTWLKQNWFKIGILVFVALGFYGFLVRPDIVAKSCNTYTLGKVNKQKEKIGDISYGSADEVYKFWFRECENGKIFH